MSTVRGFTLIELLVVIAIISILAVIGITIFTSVQRNARDARRKGDINAVAKAWEVNKGIGSYLPLQASWFSSGAFPFDPTGSVYGVPFPPVPGCGEVTQDTWTNLCWYCVRTTGTAGYCTSQDYSIGNPTAPINPRWMLCSNLESGPAGANYYCSASSQ